jgi:hypothetical protein
MNAQRITRRGFARTVAAAAFVGVTASLTSAASLTPLGDLPGGGVPQRSQRRQR